LLRLGAGTPSGGGLIFDGNGNLYGASEGGGAYGAGAVFELSPGAEGWIETVLYSFHGRNDGSVPQMPLVFDNVGNIGTIDTSAKQRLPA
jgi:uncharacterized repeat protein (TIGR03803 family)